MLRVLMPYTAARLHYSSRVRVYAQTVRAHMFDIVFTRMCPDSVILAWSLIRDEAGGLVRDRLLLENGGVCVLVLSALHP